MNLESDVFVLDPDYKPVPNDLITMKMLLAEKNYKRNLFSRHIITYSNGSIVSKHCAPWGDLDILHNEVFTIEKKFFNMNAELDSVLIKQYPVADNREYLIGPKFFLGWLDNKTMQDYEKFKA